MKLNNNKKKINFLTQLSQETKYSFPAKICCLLKFVCFLHIVSIAILLLILFVDIFSGANKLQFPPTDEYFNCKWLISQVNDLIFLHASVIKPTIYFFVISLSHSWQRKFANCYIQRRRWNTHNVTSITFNSISGFLPPKFYLISILCQLQFFVFTSGRELQFVCMHRLKITVNMISDTSIVKDYQLVFKWLILFSFIHPQLNPQFIFFCKFSITKSL